MNPIFIIAESKQDYIDFCQRYKLNSDECVYVCCYNFEETFRKYSKSITFNPLLEIHATLFALNSNNIKLRIFDFIHECLKDLKLKARTVLERDEDGKAILVCTEWSRIILT